MIHNTNYKQFLKKTGYESDAIYNLYFRVYCMYNYEHLLQLG